MKAAKTCSVMWPASMLPNSRTLWETGRERNDITSMTTIIGRKNTGTPFGTNSLGKRRPCFQRP